MSTDKPSSGTNSTSESLVNLGELREEIDGLDLQIQSLSPLLISMLQVVHYLFQQQLQLLNPINLLALQLEI